MLISARPAFQVAGKDAPDLSAGLVSLATVETAAGLARCEARFTDWGARQGQNVYLFDDRSTLDFGKALTVTFNGQTLFDGRITALEGHFPEQGAPELTALAEDRLQDLRMTRRTRTFLNTTDADVVRAVASGSGLSAQVDLDGPAEAVIAQVNLSDLAFLRERMRRIDGQVWVEGSTLNAAARSRPGGQAIPLDYPGAVRSFSALADLAGQRTSVMVSGWDPSSKAAVNVEATDAILNGELRGAQSGASLLRQVFGTRAEVIVHRGPLDAGRARREAEAAFRQMARRFLIGRGVAEPDGRLKVGRAINVSNVGPLFSGTYRLVEVRHVFDDSDGGGLRTEFEAERSGL